MSTTMALWCPFSSRQAPDAATGVNQQTRFGEILKLLTNLIFNVAVGVYPSEDARQFSAMFI
jgi:hypothetical protein